MMCSGRWMGPWQSACCNSVDGRQALMFSLNGWGPFLFLGVAMTMLLLLRHLQRFLWYQAFSLKSDHSFNVWWSLGVCESQKTGSQGYGFQMIVLKCCFGVIMCLWFSTLLFGASCCSHWCVLSSLCSLNTLSTAKSYL